MRLLFISNFPWAKVGYGRIIKNLLPELNKTHTCGLLTNYGIEDHQRLDNFWQGMTVYGRGQGTGHAGFNEDVAIKHVQDFQADAVIVPYDVWAFTKLPALLHQNRIPFVPYAPVDTHKLNPIYVETLKYAFRVIPMSEHSEKCVREFYDEKCYPHIFPGVNTNVFKPLWKTKEEKNKLKRKLGFDEDTFIITLAGDLKSYRLSWAENLEAIKIFREQNPQIKIGLYIHTLLTNANPTSFNLQELINDLGLGDITRVIDQYSYLKGISDEEMAKTYNASNVFVQCSRGHGAGMMYLESAACGTPSLATNFSSTQSVVDGKTGFLVKPKMLVYEPHSAKKAIPDPYDIARKIKMVYDKGSTSFRDYCVSFAQDYEWKKIIKEQWLPTLERLEKDIKRACLGIPKNIGEKIKENAKNIQIIE